MVKVKVVAKVVKVKDKFKIISKVVKVIKIKIIAKVLRGSRLKT